MIDGSGEILLKPDLKILEISNLVGLQTNGTITFE